jgi:integrase
MALGSFDALSLAAARKLARDAREQVATGVDPIGVKRAERAAKTFKECADIYLKAHGSTWKTEAQRESWKRHLGYAKSLHAILVKEVAVDDVLQVLTKLRSRPTVARATLSLIRSVIDMATAKGLRPIHAGNPADYRIIKHTAPIKHRTKHNAAMPYAEVPAFVATLRAKRTTARQALEFLILTGVRKNEATGARFDEFDFDAGVWTIPAERMKTGRAHSVPLTERMKTIVVEQQLNYPNSEFVFPGWKRTHPHLGDQAFSHIVPEEFTVHGFRSSLRDYLGNETSVSYVTAEEVLSHAVGDSTVRAYRRSDALAKRKEALDLWGRFIDENTRKSSNVVEFQTVSRATA